MLRKIIGLVLACSMLLVILAACTPSQPATPPATDGGGETAPAEELTSRERVYQIIERDPIRFSGIPPDYINDRSHINKAVVGQEPRENLRIGMTMSYLGAPFFRVMESNLRELFEADGHEFTVQISDRNLEVAGQQIDAFIAQQKDLIIVHSPAQSHTANYRRIAEAGIPVLATSNQLADEMGSQATLFISNSYAAGFNTGVYTARNVFDPANPDRVFNIAVVLNQVGSADSETRGNAFTAGFLYGKAYMEGNQYDSIWDAMLDAYALWDEFMRRGTHRSDEFGINFMGFGQGETPDPPGGQRAANDLITAHGRDMDILLIETCGMFHGGVDVVLHQHSIIPGQDVIVVGTADASRLGMQSIKSGEILALGYNSSAMIAMGAQQFTRGVFRDNDQDRMNNLIPNTIMPGPVVTRSNVDDFYDPESELARPFPVTLMTVTEYNAAVDPQAPPFDMIGLTVPLSN